MPCPGGLLGLAGFIEAASKYSGTFGSGAGTVPAGAPNDCACVGGAERTASATAATLARRVSLRIGLLEGGPEGPPLQSVLPLDPGRVPLVRRAVRWHVVCSDKWRWKSSVFRRTTGR